MSLNAIMNIGRSSLSLFQAATEITSENIANVNTPGYSRQRVIIETAPPVQSNGFPLGTGAQIASVERYYDGLLQKQLVNAESGQGYDTKNAQVLQQVEPVFNEIAYDGLGNAISDYFGAWQDLTLNPAGTTERQNVLAQGQILADNFHNVSTTLNNTIDIQDSSLVPMVSEINSALTEIAQLNAQISQIKLSSGDANETLDKRDQLIRDLSQKIGITYTENANGTTDINYADGGAALVTGGIAGAFSLAVSGVTGRYDVSVTPAGGGAAAAVLPVTGELGATIALRDTIIPGYLTQVDTLAKSIVDQVNALHSAGYDPIGGTGQNFFAPIGAIAGAAGAIALDGGLTTTKIAAAQAPALPGDNRNALKIAQLFNDKTTMAGATFSGYYNNLVSTVGLDVKSSQNNVAQGEAFIRQLSTLRESNSGVSLDEELTNLIIYQRSYQASAKLINTATEMMDTVIGLIR